MLKHIEQIMKLLKKESKQWVNPIVTEVSEVNKDPFWTLISCVLSLRTKDEVTIGS